MYTQCSDCLTIYLVEPEALAQARGSVICKHCTAVFDALRTLTANLPVGVQHLPQHESDATVPELTLPIMRPAAAAKRAARP
ncbi:zinc-ribbon domain-containing protein, partial [Rudaea sp.]|uniref:zinc-ribbon domain-containing protein n=1 Tax=Rudaea sp. TaxID=2136325 RepID=UPI002ECFB269